MNRDAFDQDIERMIETVECLVAQSPFQHRHAVALQYVLKHEHAQALASLYESYQSNQMLSLFLNKRPPAASPDFVIYDGASKARASKYYFQRLRRAISTCVSHVVSLRQSGSSEEVLQLLSMISDISPFDEQTMLQLALTYARQGRLKEALATFGQLSSSIMESAQFSYQKGGILKRLGRYGQALESLATAGREANAIHAQVCFQQGTVLRYLAHPERALSSFREASVQTGSNPLYQVAESVALRELGALDEAAVLLAVLKPATCSDDLAKASPGALTQAVLWHMEHKNLQRAMTAIQRRQTAMGRRATDGALVFIPSLDMSAMPDLALCFDSRPSNPILYYAKGHGRNGNSGLAYRDVMRDALERTRFFLRQTSQNIALGLREGVLLSTLGEHEEALLLFHRLAQHDKQGWAPLLQAALMLRYMGRYDEAIDLFHSCLSVDRYAIVVWLYLGITQCECGRLKDARKTFEAALGIAPGERFLFYYLSLALDMSQKREQAQQFLMLAASPVAEELAGDSEITLQPISDGDDYERNIRRIHIRQ